MNALYDARAAIYDDTRASIMLPNVRYYVQIVREVGGFLLEIGCGTGHVFGGLRTTIISTAFHNLLLIFH